MTEFINFASPPLADVVERRAETPHIAPHEMLADKEYVLVAHFTSAGAIRFFGPFRPKVPISHDQLVRGTYSAKVVFTEDGDRPGALLLPASGCFCLLMGRVEYALYEYTPALAVRIRGLREFEDQHRRTMEREELY